MKKRRARGLAARSADTAQKAAPYSSTQPRHYSDERQTCSDCPQQPPQETMPSSSACQPLDEIAARPGVIAHMIDGFIIEEYLEPLPSSFATSVRENKQTAPPVLGPRLSLASATAAALDKCTSLPTSVTSVVPTTSQAVTAVVNTYQVPTHLSLASAPAAPSDKWMSLPTAASSVGPTMSQATTAVMNTYQAPTYDSGPVSLQKWGVDQFTAPLGQACKPTFFRNSPRKWTVEEVTGYIWGITGCADYAEKFRTQEIDGEAMFLLEEHHLMTVMNIKLGPALIICSRIRSLQEKL